jgi:hypothetical protein
MVCDHGFFPRRGFVMERLLMAVVKVGFQAHFDDQEAMPRAFWLAPSTPHPISLTNGGSNRHMSYHIIRTPHSLLRLSGDQM